MTKTITQHSIYSLEDKLKETRSIYLRLHGWQRTCNTPGSFWMWTRDFADVDEKRRSHHPPKASPFHPYGVIMADTEMAVMMTMRALDVADEDAAGSDGPTYLDFITPDEVFDKGPDAVKQWKEAKRAEIEQAATPKRCGGPDQ